MWLFVASAVLAFAMPFTLTFIPIVMVIEAVGFAAVALSLLSGLFALVSLVLVYYKQRNTFGHLFGYMLGMSIMSRGIGNAAWPISSFDWGVFALTAIVFPLVVAILLKRVVQVARIGQSEMHEVFK